MEQRIIKILEDVPDHESGSRKKAKGGKQKSCYYQIEIFSYHGDFYVYQEQTVNTVMSAVFALLKESNGVSFIQEGKNNVLYSCYTKGFERRFYWKFSKNSYPEH